MMFRRRPRAFDHELFIGTWLWIGVVVSAVLIAAGLVLFFVQHRTGYPAGRPLDLASLLRYEPNLTPALFPTTLRAVVAGTLQLRPYAVIELGLLLLIGTPVMRVAFSIVAFALERDRQYTLYTTIVLAILLLSFFLGRVGE